MIRAIFLAVILSASVPVGAQGLPDGPVNVCTEEYLYVTVGPATLEQNGRCSVPEASLERPLSGELPCPKILVAVPVGPYTVYYAPCTTIWVEENDGWP